MKKLTNLILKPLFQCICKCPQCVERQKFYKNEIQKNIQLLSLKRIKELFYEANELGTKTLQLSGGEILLYNDLIEIIKEAKKYKWFVFVNSVGWDLNEEKARFMIEAGLNAFNVSLDSSRAAQHDKIRGVKGLFSSALRTLTIFGQLRKKYPHVYTNIQTIIIRQNYDQIHELFRIALEKDVSSIYLMHICDDLNNKFRLDVKQIEVFNNKVIPEVIKVMEEYHLKEDIINYGKRHLRKLFETNTNTLENYQNGIYWNKIEHIRNICTSPNRKLLILPNGDAVTCCTMENSESVLVGNVNNKSLSEIWMSEKMEDFRKNRSVYCLRCPSMRNRTIGLVPSMLSQF
ncbi:radical SAM protein [Candidatus Woesearchaeota archaeon]|nr:radical SAM protein [Candidatus Woesearchaeota archaeon]